MTAGTFPHRYLVKGYTHAKEQGALPATVAGRALNLGLMQIDMAVLARGNAEIVDQAVVFVEEAAATFLESVHTDDGATMGQLFSAMIGHPIDALPEPIARLGLRLVDQTVAALASGGGGRRHVPPSVLATLCIAAAHFDADRRSWAEWALLYEGMDEGKLDEGLVARLCSVAKWRNERLVPLIDGSVHSTPGWPNANGCARALWAHRSARLTDDGGHLGLSS